jgi:hypothetical protein
LSTNSSLRDNQVVEMTEVVVVGHVEPNPTARGASEPADGWIHVPSAVLAIAVFIAYMIGAGRGYGYDASVTIAEFIRGGNPFHAFTNAYALNNHVAFSILDSIVWRFGGRNEVAQRVLPVLAVAFCIYVVSAWTSRRRGPVAGIVSGLVIAATPLVVEQSRDVRGYSLAMLCMTGAVLLIVNDVTPGPGPLRLGPSARGICVSCLLGVAIGSHLFSGLALAGVVPWIAAADRTALRRWRRPLIRGVLLGALIYLPTLSYMVGVVRHGPPGHVQPAFPFSLGRELLGHSLWAVALLAVVLLVGAAAARSIEKRTLLPAVAAILGLAAPTVVLWIVLHPSQLFPRFFVWLVPAVAVAVGVAIGKRPPLAVPALIAIIVMVAAQAPKWTTDPLPNRQMASVLRRMDIQGPICAVRATGEPMMAYGFTPVGLFIPSNAHKCAVLIGPISTEHYAVTKAAIATMPYRRDFNDSVQPGFLLSNVPIPDR